MEENVKKKYVVYALWRPQVEEAEWKGEKREFINFYGVGFLNSIKNEKKIIAVYDDWRDANIVKTRLEAIKREEYYKYLKSETFIRFVKDHPQMSLADLIVNYNANSEIPEEAFNGKKETT